MPKHIPTCLIGITKLHTQLPLKNQLDFAGHFLFRRNRNVDELNDITMTAKNILTVVSSILYLNNTL